MHVADASLSSSASDAARLSNADTAEVAKGPTGVLVATRAAAAPVAAPAVAFGVQYHAFQAYAWHGRNQKQEHKEVQLQTKQFTLASPYLFKCCCHTVHASFTSAMKNALKSAE